MLYSETRTRARIAGFTLIELLVVISIIGLLASVVLIGMRSVRTKSFDVQKRMDIASFSKILEGYAMANSEKYPISHNDEGDGGDCAIEKLGQFPLLGATPIIGADMTSFPTVKYEPDPEWKYYKYVSCGEGYTLWSKLLATGKQYGVRVTSAGSPPTFFTRTITSAPDISGITVRFARRESSNIATSHWLLDMSNANIAGIDHYTIHISDEPVVSRWGSGYGPMTTVTPCNGGCVGNVQIPFETWDVWNGGPIPPIQSIPASPPSLYIQFVKIWGFDAYGNMAEKTFPAGAGE
ncbi:MAG: type II secretion system protein [bacterium]|nr:type II secretion system protein [bacterium]